MIALWSVGWFEVFGGDAPRDALQMYLGRLPRSWLIRTIARLSNTTFNSGAYYTNPQQQIEFINTFARGVTYTDRIARLVATRPGGVLIQPDLVASLTRYALLYASRDDSLPRDWPDRLLRSILIFNQIFNDTHTDLKKGSESEQFLKYELRSAMNTHGNLSYVLARYRAFLTWAREQKPSRPNYLPVDVDIQRFFGFDYTSYAASALSVTARFINGPPLGQWEQQVADFEPASYLANVKDRDVILSWIETFAVDIEEASKQIKEYPDTFSPADLRPFLLTPLLKDGRDFICPHPGLLHNILGLGFYFSLFDRYRAEGKEERFASFFGDFLEQYVFKRLKSATRKRSTGVYSEVEYGKNGAKSSDVVLAEPPVAIFVEVTKKRFQTIKALHDLDERQVVKDLDGMVVRKAGQLTRTIADFRASLYKYEGLNNDDVTRIFPVIVTEQEIPRFIAIYDQMMRMLGDAGYLEECEELLTISVEEIEALDIACDGDLDLIAMLEQKAKTPESRRVDLTTYLAKVQPTLFHVKPDSRSDPEFMLVTREVGARLKEWGLG